MPRKSKTSLRLRTGAKSNGTGANGGRKQGRRGRAFPAGNQLGRKFEPGQSGNPGGRPRRTMADFRELFSEDTESVLRGLKHGALAGLYPSTKFPPPTAAGVAAAHEFLDRIWGKSPQPITGGDGGPVRVTYDVVRSKLEEIAKGALAERESANGASHAPEPAEADEDGHEPQADPNPESA